MFVFMCDIIMENGRHLGIFKKAAGLNMFVVPTVPSVFLFGRSPRMAYSLPVNFEFINSFLQGGLEFCNKLTYKTLCGNNYKKKNKPRWPIISQIL